MIDREVFSSGGLLGDLGDLGDLGNLSIHVYIYIYIMHSKDT